MSEFTKRPVVPINPAVARSAEEILTALANCSFQGRNLANALDVLQAMVQDRGCGVVLTLAGAMVPAGMGELICQLMEKKIIQAIVTTGANLSHDLVNAAKGGEGHFLGDPQADDDELYKNRINRIYDTNLPEDNYLAAEEVLEGIWRPLQADWNEANPARPMLLAPSEVFRLTGQGLAEQKRHSLFSVAYETQTPIFCGATSDSEFCLNFARYRYRGWCNLILDEIDDLFRMGEWVRSYERRGVVIVGGGVPRNWAQQIFPLLDMIDEAHFPGYDFGVRISTDNVVFGGLSGCTIEESKSWGKYGSEARFAEVNCDATIALPFLTAALFDRLGI